MKTSFITTATAALIFATFASSTMAATASGAHSGFQWKDTKGQYLDLLLDGKKVTRYMYTYDKSTPQRRFETYKPFLHVYSPDGQRLTNGPDGQSPYIQKDILYPHHRGIFIGWNKVGHDGKTYDLWHMKGVEQVHKKFLQLDAGPDSATCVALIDWLDSSGKPIIVEQRRTIVYRTDKPSDIRIDFTSSLKAIDGDIMLGGNAEHAGFHYRANDTVAKGPKEDKATYLFNKDGIDAHKDGNLPWVAMSYGLNGKRYNVLLMNHPDNPRPSRYSAYRDYGRFGVFFTKEIGAGQTLTLKYRLWIAEGGLPSRDFAQAKYAEFINRSGH